MWPFGRMRPKTGATRAQPAPAPVASVPIQRRATGTPSTEWFAPLPTVAADSPASAARPRLTLGQSRRLGLGAPLSKMPDHTVQRSVDESAPLPLAPGMPAREPAGPSSPMPASSDQPGSAVSTETASVPQATIQRSAADSSAPLLGPPLQRQRDIAVQREAIESRPPPGTPTDRERLDMPLAPTNQPATAGQLLQELSEPAPHQVADSPVQTSAARGIGPMPPIVQRLDASASDEEASEAESVQRRGELEHEKNQAGG